MKPIHAVLSTFLLSSICGSALGQDKLSGFHQYPQFRTFSGLPGSGYALSPDGDFDPSGATAFSTPIAFNLGQMRFVFGGGNTSPNEKILFPTLDKSNVPSSRGNGTGVFSGGLSLGSAGTLSATVMVLSSVGDDAFNFQYSPGRQTGQWRYSVGVQDLTGQGGASGAQNPGDNDSSRSFYGVATYDFKSNGTYASFGGGEHRFSKGFANVSTNLFRDAKAYVEYEGSFFNYGVLYAVPLTKPSKDSMRALRLQASLALVDNRYAAWGIFLTF